MTGTDEESPIGDMLAAVRDAARVCRYVQRTIGSGGSMTKEDRSPVTIADYASQAVVARALARVPGQRLVAEESAEHLGSPAHGAHLSATVVALRESGVWPKAAPEGVLRAIGAVGEPPSGDSAEAWWTLDPIDGTKGFLRGQQYAVALARIVGGRPVLGVMACPNLSIDHGASVDEADPRGTLYLAAAGQGVVEWVLGRLDGRALQEPVAARPVPVLAESVDAAHSDQSLSTRIMASAAGEHRVLRLDSQCKYAVVARGQADAYLRLPARKGYVERVWDHAAGLVIAEQAGCTVTDMHGRPLDFGRGRGLEANTGVVVARAPLHGRILGAIAALYGAES